jgi:hypothetical protein
VAVDSVPLGSRRKLKGRFLKPYDYPVLSKGCDNMSNNPLIKEEIQPILSEENEFDTLKRIYNLSSLHYIDFEKQDRLTAILSRWPLLSEL